MSQTVFTPSNEARIAVFAEHADTSGLPHEYVTRDEGRDMEKRGDARWVNGRHKALIIVRKGPRKPMVRDSDCRGVSCRMPLSVAEKAMKKSWYHQSLVDAWKQTPVRLVSEQKENSEVEDANPRKAA